MPALQEDPRPARNPKGFRGASAPLDRKARTRALQAAWDTEANAFRCHYTGIELDTTDGHDHRYLSLEHQKPGDESEIVVSALINRMKTDLSDTEFRRLVTALAASFQDGEFDPAAFPDRPFLTPRNA